MQAFQPLLPTILLTLATCRSIPSTPPEVIKYLTVSSGSLSTASITAHNNVIDNNLIGGLFWARRDENHDEFFTGESIWVRGIESDEEEGGKGGELTDEPIWARGLANDIKAQNTDAILTDGPIWARGNGGDAEIQNQDGVLTDGPIWDKKSVQDNSDSQSTESTDAILTDGPISARSFPDSVTDYDADIDLTDSPIWSRRAMSSN